jgi:type III pantothenate kinase
MSGSAIGELIAVDLGNSAVKLSTFVRSGHATPERDGGATVCVGGEPVVVPATALASPDREAPPVESLRVLLNSLPASPRAWYAVSVNRAVEGAFRRWISRWRPRDPYVLLDHQRLALATDLAEPERIGTDRLAAAVAAHACRDRDRDAIIIDAGTAVTVDLLTADGVFRGGAILPGMRTAAAALAQATDALPHIEPPGPTGTPAAIGKSTRAAIEAGVFWGCVGGVRELVRRIGGELARRPDVFCTGGDGAHLARQLDPPVRLDPHLVLRGVALTGFRLSAAAEP